MLVSLVDDKWRPATTYRVDRVYDRPVSRQSPSAGRASRYRTPVSHDQTEDLRGEDLSAGKRWLAALVATAAFAGAGFYIAWPRSMVVVAPQCTGGTDCNVDVSAAPEAAVVVALLVIAAAFSLTAVTGQIFAFSFGGGSVAPTRSEAKKVDKVPGDAEPVTTEEPAGEAPADPSRHALALWNKLPENLRAAAAIYAEDNWDMSLTEVQLATKDVFRRGSGRGNHPYWATFASPKGNVTLKLYAGGRSGGTHASAQ